MPRDPTITGSIDFWDQQNEFPVQLVDLVFKIYRRVWIRVKKDFINIALKEIVKILVVLCRDLVILPIKKYIDSLCRIQDLEFGRIDLTTLIKFCQIIPFCFAPFII